MISRKQLQEEEVKDEVGLGLQGVSGEGSDSDWELACCLLHATENTLSNQSAGSVLVCALQKKLLSNTSTG